jgi:hypothetical protein
VEILNFCIGTIEASKISGYAPRTIEGLCAKGIIKAKKIGCSWVIDSRLFHLRKANYVYIDENKIERIAEKIFVAMKERPILTEAMNFDDYISLSDAEKVEVWKHLRTSGKSL